MSENVQEQQQPVKEQEEEEIDEEEQITTKMSKSIGKEETRALLASFDDENLDRYEAFRRAHLPKAAVRKIVGQLTGAAPASVAIVVAGVGKVFIGEIVESALDIMDEWGHSGPIKPEHLREAYRRYQIRTGTLANRYYTKRLF